METESIWQLVVAVTAVIVAGALSLLGKGFGKWADNLEEMTKRMDARLSAIQTSSDSKWDKANEKLDRQEEELKKIHVCMERRISTLEVRVSRFDK